jgi:dihydrofolate synthase/folylpolyglutamate synthase
MTYTEAVSYLYDHLPMYQRIGVKAIKKGLDNIILLCEHLGNPHHQFKSIHVAGTNGKGSSSHMIAAILQSEGYKTGLYTSPHLKELTERIRVNGSEIPPQVVADWITQYQNLIEEIQPSFFELMVALAFDYFAQQKIDIAVIEVGLGGRLDSTNIIQPMASLITTIGYDHQDMLGETLPEIALEKAGIIKRDTPVVISYTQREVEHVFMQQAKMNQSSIVFADQLLELKSPRMEDSYLTVDVLENGILWLPVLQSGLVAYYQLKNIPGVLAITKELNRQGIIVSDQSIREGIQYVTMLTGLKGRWQVIHKKPTIICDTGHNEDGIREVLKQLSYIYYRNLIFILGFVKDKKVEKILSLLPSQATYFFCQAHIPRAMEAKKVQHIAESLGIQGKIILDVNEAITEAKKEAHPDDLIVVGGSTFVVAEVNQL